MIAAAKLARADTFITRLPNGNIIVDGNKLLEQLGVIRYQGQKEQQ